MYTRHDPTSSRKLPPTVKIDGSKIKEIRESQGLTQLYVATAVGVTTDTISRWENRKYPTIKRENALKLAEALEVDVEEILETEEEPEKEQAEQKQPLEQEEETKATLVPSRLSPFFQNRAKGLLILASLLFVGGLFFLWLHSRSTVNIDIAAMRILPSHSAPGTAFPVLIEVDIHPKTVVSLLVKEELPSQISPVKGNPSYTVGNGAGVLKWIFQGNVDKKTFCYTAKMDKNVSLGQKIRFSGTLTVRKKGTKKIDIAGDSTMSVEPFHWADLNKDNTIDDEEILTVYDLFSGLKAVEPELKDLEAIWSAGHYKWDGKQAKFVIISDKSGEKE